MPEVEPRFDDLQERLAPLAVQGIRRLAGGASSLTYAGTIASGRQVVVKVAPTGVPPVLNRDVLRQARLLRALAGTAVPVPEVLWEDAGGPPEVPPLFVTSFVPGVSFEPLFDLDGDDDVAIVTDRMRSAARVMAALHALDPIAIGLGGEPAVGPSEEVERWCRLLATVDAMLAPGWEDVAAALRAAEPPALPGAVVHGDYRLGNMLCDGTTITGVIDWEIWTIGDPRVDLGWFLVNTDPDTYRRPTRYADALPSPAELATIYGDVPDLAWFEALACFKSTATWSLIVKHNRRRPEPDPDLEVMATVLPPPARPGPRAPRPVTQLRGRSAGRRSGAGDPLELAGHLCLRRFQGDEGGIPTERGRGVGWYPLRTCAPLFETSTPRLHRNQADEPAFRYAPCMPSADRRVRLRPSWRRGR